MSTSTSTMTGIEFVINPASGFGEADKNNAARDFQAGISRSGKKKEEDATFNPFAIVWVPKIYQYTATDVFAYGWEKKLTQSREELEEYGVEVAPAEPYDAAYTLSSTQEGEIEYAPHHDS